MTSPISSPVSEARAEGFDDFNTKEVRRLTAELVLAQQQQSAAAAVSDALATRLAAFQKTLVTAQTNSATATANLAECQSITQTVAKAQPLADASSTQGHKIAAKVGPVFTAAYATALLYLDALQTITDLANQVQIRKSKNDFTSPNIISSIGDLNSGANTALQALTTALQKTMIAVAAAEEASGATDQVIKSNQRLRDLLAPPAPFNPQVPNSPLVWPSSVEEPTDSVVLLADIVKHQDLPIQSVLDSLSKIALYQMQEQQAATTQTGLQLNAANNALDRATAKALAAQAALTAAEAAVE